MHPDGIHVLGEPLPIIIFCPEEIHTRQLDCILGYSQGGLLARAILENLPDHNVKHFISLSSPQAGQYGSTFRLTRNRIKIFFDLIVSIVHFLPAS